MADLTVDEYLAVIRKPRSQFIVLTDPLSGPVQLREPIDNSAGDKWIGLREVTYAVGWHNVSAALRNNTFAFNLGLNGQTVTIDIPDGWYNMTSLGDIIRANVPGGSGIAFSLNSATGYITTTISADSEEVNFGTCGPLFGYMVPQSSADGWMTGPGVYPAPHRPSFYSSAGPDLYVHLDQVNTTGNLFNGKPSTLLTTIEKANAVFSDYRSVVYEQPHYRKLQSGFLHELSLSLLDESGHVDMHSQRFSVILEIV